MNRYYWFGWKFCSFRKTVEVEQYIHTTSKSGKTKKLEKGVSLGVRVRKRKLEKLQKLGKESGESWSEKTKMKKNNFNYDTLI